MRLIKISDFNNQMITIESISILFIAWCVCVCLCESENGLETAFVLVVEIDC